MSLNFLISSERSGSNFITKLLNGHSNICGPSTKHILNPVLRNLFRYTPLEDDRRWNILLDDIHKLLVIDFSVWKKNFSRSELTKLAPRGDINSLLKNIFLAEAKEHGKQHLFIKENHVYEFLPYLLLNFPESKYVCLVRDPRDMALSWKKNFAHPGGVVNAAKQWKVDQQNLLKNNYLLQVKSFLTTYERLITDPEEETKKIVEFLGLTYESKMMEFYKDELTKKNAHQLEGWKNLSKSVLHDNKSKYVSELTDQEIKFIEKICYFEMVQLGYKPEYKIKDLEKIGESEIFDFGKEEQVKLHRKKPLGVTKNMEAKKVFYTKIIDKIN